MSMVRFLNLNFLRTIARASVHVTVSPEVIDHDAAAVISDLGGAPMHIAVDVRASPVGLPLKQDISLPFRVAQIPIPSSLVIFLELDLLTQSKGIRTE